MDECNDKILKSHEKRWRCLLVIGNSPGSLTPEKQRLLTQHAVHWLQLSIQHNHLTNCQHLDQTPQCATGYLTSSATGCKFSESLTHHSTGAPQGCVLSPVFYILLIHDCIAKHRNDNILTFADDNTVVRLMNNNEEKAYRDEVNQLIAWCHSTKCQQIKSEDCWLQMH